MSRYQDTTWAIRNMLLHIEAEHQELVASYLNYIGSNELPIPTDADDAGRKWRVWELWDNWDADPPTQYWYQTDVNADMSGYIMAMTAKQLFGDEEPPLPGAPKRKRKSNGNTNS